MNQRLSTASQAKLGTESSFAATQAAWRFYAHENTTLETLSEPLIEASIDGVERQIAGITRWWCMIGVY
jgi:hypothetical protein